jgi:hypothetical protein
VDAISRLAKVPTSWVFFWHFIIGNVGIYVMAALIAELASV